MIKNGQTLLIREAERSDAERVFEHFGLACRETDFLSFGQGEIRLTLQAEADYIERSKGTENCIYLLALSGETIAGILFFWAGVRPRTRHSGEFGVTVLKEYWGLGIASLLMDSMLEWAKNNNIIKKINLRTRADNHRAIALYERKGFEVEGILKKDTFTDGVYYDTLWMGLII